MIKTPVLRRAQASAYESRIVLKEGDFNIPQLLRDDADEIERLTTKVSRLQTVANYAKDFMDQYKLVIQSDEYKGIWTFLHVHNNEYRGLIFRDPEYLIAALDTLSGSQPQPDCEHVSDDTLWRSYHDNSERCSLCYEIRVLDDSRQATCCDKPDPVAPEDSDRVKWGEYKQCAGCLSILNPDGSVFMYAPITSSV